MLVFISQSRLATYISQPLFTVKAISMIIFLVSVTCDYTLRNYLNELYLEITEKCSFSHSVMFVFF